MILPSRSVESNRKHKKRLFQSFVPLYRKRRELSRHRSHGDFFQKEIHGTVRNLERVKKVSNSKEPAELFREKLFFAAFLPTGRQANAVEDKQKIIFSEKADFLNTLLVSRIFYYIDRYVNALRAGAFENL